MGGIICRSRGRAGPWGRGVSERGTDTSDAKAMAEKLDSGAHAPVWLRATAQSWTCLCPWVRCHFSAPQFLHL